jgi:hypothetical protein
MPHVREREPNPDELPDDQAKKAGAENGTSSNPDPSPDADVETDAASPDPQPGS